MSTFARFGPRPLLGFTAALAPLALVIAGCSPAEGPSSIYVVPQSLSDLHDEGFFDHPWPSDLRLENGSPRLEGYYNPRSITIISEYLEAMKGILDGFSPAAAGYVRFTTAIDTSTLPASPKAALEASSSVQLIDVDPASPEKGKRHLVSLEWHETEGVYIRPDTLAFMPTIGFPLRAHTRYALVVTDALKAAGGGLIAPSEDLSAVLGITSPDERTRPAHDAIASTLVELSGAGITKDHIVHLTVFTTSDPTKELFAVRDRVRKDVPAPTAYPDKWQVSLKASYYTEYVGAYGPSPNYQAGKLPFQNYGDGGQFQIEDGVPKVVDTFDLRFSLMVPTSSKCPMPAEGFPIVLYAHGTGGDFESYVGDGSGRSLVTNCVAAMGVDQIFHGTRPGAPPNGDEGTIELLFFNFENPVAARTNPRQSAIDEVQRSRLFTETMMTVPAGVSTTGKEVHFDPKKVLFFGHSQGGLNGPLYLASDDSALGGVLSGSGALVSIGLLDKTLPSPSVSGLVKTVFLGLKADETAEADVFHPIISLAQSMIDVADPIHYARYIITDPRPGMSPRSVYMTEGINPDGTGDSYAPPHGIEAHALAMGLPLQAPGEHAILESQWGGAQPVTVPSAGLSGNLADGRASGVLAQWAVPSGKDGHFVVFQVPKARTQAARFVKNLADNPVGLIPAP
jgi:predicted esterase